MTKLTSKFAQNDTDMYAIIALNTGGSTTVEQNILKCAGLTPLKALTGMYKGQTEQSYLVAFDDPTKVFNIARDYSQESILVLSSMLKGERFAYIQNTNFKEISIAGKWVNHGSLKPAGDGYTFDGEQYYTIFTQ